MDLLESSCRVAFAALIHDLGKFAQRAEKSGASRFPRDKLDGNFTTYCPFREEGGYHSHHHAAWTALAFDELEDKFPDVINADCYPFASRKQGEDITDSLINAAAAHHKPDSFLQRIVAEADRTASGFEREEFEKYNTLEDKTDTGRNHFQARLLPLFEQLLQKKAEKAPDLKFRYPLKALSPAGIFPEKRELCEPSDDVKAQAEYKELWDAFVKGLEKIPASHRASWALWLDHFDSLWLAYTHAVPAATSFGVKPDVSLYDHSKATAALAVALWRHAHDAAGRGGEETVRDMWDPDAAEEKKYLLIQGDFFGIQDFIFAEGSQTNKNAAKLLRGRSFQVSLFSELAALKILETLELPPTSRILNAAGKFLIVAHNTPKVKEQLEEIRQEFNTWFLQHTFGLAGIGLAWEPARRIDFCGKHNEKSRFEELLQTLFESLEKTKYQRFDLCRRSDVVVRADFTHGVCKWQGKLPADGEAGGNDGGDSGKSCALSRDQLLIGKSLVQRTRVLVVRENDADRLHGDKCELPVFGYRIMFAEDRDVRGDFGALAASGALRRCWDFSLPQNMEAPLWDGCARRQINGCVPHFSQTFAGDFSKKQYGKEAAEEIKPGALKSFTHIACEDREPDTAPDAPPDRLQGQIALTVLKGDVDNLGTIFKEGLSGAEGQKPTFAKSASLSRQLDSFFSLYLPALCAEKYPDVYTVFAGGDDFFLIGPWLSTQKLAGRMAEEFSRYTAHNPELHFSAGMVMKKPGSPVYSLADEAEEALGRAKKNDGKNSFCLFAAVASWAQWSELERAEKELGRLEKHYKLSTGFLYSLLYLLDLSLKEDRHPEASIWRSGLAYNTARMLERRRRPPLTPAERRQAQREIADFLGGTGIAGLKQTFRIPLFNHLYRQRR
ncbi:MAG: type III-A CRISPR-associated protein Cas10/Csm1 [Desulfovibrio sp.]|nr:type III-A CRISPR-associated protein Cas10/Csm1 [Desulfovibrio sp.]